MKGLIWTVNKLNHPHFG